MVNKKEEFQGGNGSAAMDFLLTYGWAILVILVAIGALYYFGVLNPDRFVPETNVWTFAAYDYCAQWDGWIDREDLFINCYDIKTNQTKCDYNINKNNQLVVHVFDDVDNYVPDQTNIYNCSIYLQSKRLVENEVK
jgi:hypothetical protein